MYTITVGALYVCVPAIMLVLAMVWAWLNPVTIEEAAMCVNEVEARMYECVRDICARKSVQALAMWQHAKSSGNMRAAQVWLDEALEKRDRALRYDARARGMQTG